MTNSKHLGLLIVILCTSLGCHSQIAKPPSNQIVTSNDTAVFNCSLSCSQLPSVMWYMVLPSSGRTLAISPYTPLNQIKSIYGIDVSRGTVNECPQGGYVVEQLFVRAKQQLNLMPVQCSIVCLDGNCACDTSQEHFSRVGVLSIVPDISQSKGIERSILPSQSLSIAPSSTKIAGYLQDSAVVPSSCISYVHTTTVTLSCGADNPTPQVSQQNK